MVSVSDLVSDVVFSVGVTNNVPVRLDEEENVSVYSRLGDFDVESDIVKVTDSVKVDVPVRERVPERDW